MLKNPDRKKVVSSLFSSVLALSLLAGTGCGRRKPIIPEPSSTPVVCPPGSLPAPAGAPATAARALKVRSLPLRRFADAPPTAEAPLPEGCVPVPPPPPPPTPTPPPPPVVCPPGSQPTGAKPATAERALKVRSLPLSRFADAAPPAAEAPLPEGCVPVPPPPPPPTPTATPDPIEVERNAFYEQLASEGHENTFYIDTEIRQAVLLQVKDLGWTNEEAVKKGWDATKNTFKGDIKLEEFKAYSKGFANNKHPDNVYFVDLQYSKSELDLVILKHDPYSNQIIGVSDEVPAGWEWATTVEAKRLRANGIRQMPVPPALHTKGADYGTIFFYAGNGKQFLNKYRFVKIPQVIYDPSVKSKQLQKMN